MANPTASNIWGKTVAVGDLVTILGAASAVSGTGVKASITVVTKLGDSFTALAGGCYAPQNPAGAAQNENGKTFAAGDPLNVNGLVTAVSNGPSGAQGQLTVTLSYSGNVITVSSGAVDSHG
jgi:hypothetical protein